MPRPQEYDRAEVVGAAMRCFWQHGYTATSVGMLVAATRIQRFSMYQAFGDKDGLFVASLARYEREIGDYIREPLESDPRGVESILWCIGRYVNVLARSESVKGCFIVNTLIELGGDDPRSRAYISTHFNRLAAGFRVAMTSSSSALRFSDRHSDALLGLMQTLAVRSVLLRDPRALLDFANSEVDRILIDAT